jgi:crotonobetainyl-CoA:carnitine CoA-transferase CaiB-like acyl-CoA transferase
MPGPLDELLVVSLEQAVAAPYVASRLAEAGARVIKVERADGDFARAYDSVVNGESAYFVWLNRGKESIVLDIKDDKDAQLLHNIIDKADVFIQNLAPGAADRAGFGSDALRARNPDLITCDISGYGEDGPYRDMKAYDLLIQAETGLASVTGRPEGPGRVGVSIADISAGLYAFNGILLALLQRAETGAGDTLKVSLFDAMADCMSVPMLLQDYTGKPPERVGMNHPNIAPYGAYSSNDDKQVVVSIQNEREWERFCAEVLKNSELARDARFCNNESRVANRDELDDKINAVFGTLVRNEIAQRLKTAKVAFGALNSVADLSRHPQLRRVTVETTAGPVTMPAPPVRHSNNKSTPGPVPTLGQHTDAIRAEFSGTEGN